MTTLDTRHGVARTSTATRDLTWLIVIAMWLYAVVPSFLQVTLGVRPSTNVEQAPNLIALSTTALQVLKYAIIAATLLAVTQLLMSRDRPISKAYVFYALPGVAAIGATFVAAADDLSTSIVLYPLIGLLIAAHPDRAKVAQLIGTLTGVTALLSLAMGATGFGLYSGGDAKGLFGAYLLAGPTYHPNTLGVMLVLGLPWIFMLKPGTLRRLYTVATLIAILWAASRTSWLAIGVALLVFGLWWAIPRARVVHTFGPLALFVLYVSLVPIGWFIVTTSQREDFSGRAYIWQGSLDLARMNPWFGLGPQAFPEAAMRGYTGFGPFRHLAYHAHDLVLQQAVTAGIVGVVALLVLFARILYTSWIAGRTGAAVPFVVWPIIYIVTGWLEVQAGFIDVNSLAWVVWPSLALVVMRSPALGVDDSLDAAGEDLIAGTRQVDVRR